MLEDALAEKLISVIASIDTAWYAVLPGLVDENAPTAPALAVRISLVKAPVMFGRQTSRDQLELYHIG